MTIMVANRKETPGVRGEYIGRPSPLGNPFRLYSAGGSYTREASIAAFERYLREKIAAKDAAVCAELNRLFRITAAGDLVLVCFCAPEACHGDVIRKILEERLGRV